MGNLERKLKTNAAFKIPWGTESCVLPMEWMKELVVNESAELFSRVNHADQKKEKAVLALPVLERDVKSSNALCCLCGASTLDWTFFVLLAGSLPPLPTCPQECRSRNKPPGIHDSYTEVNSFEPLAFLRPFVSQQAPQGFSSTLPADFSVGLSLTTVIHRSRSQHQRWIWLKSEVPRKACQPT